MSTWLGSILYLLGAMACIGIRIPHDKIRQKTKVVESRKGITERILLSTVAIGMVLMPMLYWTSVLAFADHKVHPASVALGILAMIGSLWLFYRSHRDLGRNWSPTLEIREEHRLVDSGVYRQIRHPMYTSIFLLGIAQLLLLGNWIAGPALLIAFSTMFFSRLKTEEKLMLDRFGDQYEAYRSRTKRVIPGVW